MNDRCTPATARRLKELGFPQPVPAPGQVWYMGQYSVLICSVEKRMRSQKKYTYVRIGETYTGFTHIVADFDCYAPTAPDILRELGKDYLLESGCQADEKVFALWQSVPGLYELDWSVISANENPAEACAEAWEAKQKQG